MLKCCLLECDKAWPVTYPPYCFPSICNESGLRASPHASSCLIIRLHVPGSTLSGLHAVDQELLRAKAFYAGDEVDSNKRMATRMAAGTGAAPGQAPPDLPSLLLDGRICYIGMPVCTTPLTAFLHHWCASVKPADVGGQKACRNHCYLKLQGRQSCWRWSQTLSWKLLSSQLIALAWAVQLVPAVTELVISELLWLNFSSPEKPVYVYLHSIGSQTPDGQAMGFDTEAYAILDTLAYIRPEIHTLVLGQVLCNYF